MKTILILFCLFWVACVSTGLKARSVASDDTSFAQSLYCFFFSCDDGDGPICTESQVAKIAKSYYEAIEVIDVDYDRSEREFIVIFLDKNNKVKTITIPRAC